ncbi:MAG: hypothetical protein ACI9NC_005926, partial [Verrucomicrobiales bacterium]
MSQALQFLILTTAGWLNRQQEDAIDYLREENRVLREQLGSKRILQEYGIDPAPERSKRTNWKTFLQAHWEGMAATDLFTGEVLPLAGLRRYFVFFVIELKTRHVHIAGIHHQPYGE